MSFFAIILTLLAGDFSEGTNAPVDRLWAKSEVHATVLPTNKFEVIIEVWPLREDDSESD